MLSLRRFFVAELAVAALGVLMIAGCGKKEDVEEGKSAKPKGKSGVKTAAAKVDGYATSIKGRVTYNGPGDQMKVSMLKRPTNRCWACPLASVFKSP